jgi:hypothetical protein
MNGHQLWSTLIKYGVSPNQLYFLDCCRYKITSINIDNVAEHKIAIENGYMTKENILTEKAIFLLNDFENLLVKTKKNVIYSVLGEEFIERIKEYNEIFPSGRLPSGKPARVNVQELKEKFVWWFKTYPEYSWDVVLDAAQYYIMLKEREGYQYTMTNGYFIKKTDIHKNTVSELANYCQMIKENPNLLTQFI